jgi:hypothetical protein
MAWYRREDYDRLLSIFEDADKLPANYDKWLASAEKGLKHLKGQGIFTVKVIIDPDQFPGWCAANGHNVDAKARIRFASIEAARQFRQSN